MSERQPSSRLLGLCLSGLFLTAVISGQEWKKGLGNKPTGTPPPAPAPSPAPTGTPGTPVKPVVKRIPVVKTPTGIVLPLGRALKFYLDEGNKLLLKEDFASAKMFFAQGLKQAGKKPPADIGQGLKNGQDQATLFIEADQQERAQNSADAVANYEQILQITPGQPSAVKRLSGLLKAQAEDAQKRGDLKAAVDFLDRLARLDASPDNTKALVTALASFAEGTTDRTAARAAYQRIVQLDPDNEGGKTGIKRLDAADRVQQGETALAARQFAEAEKLFGEALALDPANAAAVRGRNAAVAGRSLGEAEDAYRKRDFQTAQRLYTEAATMRPNDEALLARLKELSNRLAPTQPGSGSGKVILPTVTGPTRLRVRGPMATMQPSTGGDTTPVTFEAKDPLPNLSHAFRIASATDKSRVRIIALPSATNDFTAELAVELKKYPADNFRIDIDWKVFPKGRAVWKARLGPGKYKLLWQDRYFDLAGDSEPLDLSVVQDPLPHQPSEVRVKMLSGRGTAKVVTAPGATNDFTATLEFEIIDRTPVTLEITWTAK